MGCRRAINGVAGTGEAGDGEAGNVVAGLMVAGLVVAGLAAGATASFAASWVVVLLSGSATTLSISTLRLSPIPVLAQDPGFRPRVRPAARSIQAPYKQAIVPTLWQRETRKRGGRERHPERRMTPTFRHIREL